ncbi:transglycosylase SLT domain-containing protein [Streptomyces sp. XM4193]|uniref:aggregation-promoting factor C-terminal-like domain-containing protein n=1 Tax=Streptomyces sp. XM4193 TaxID=2929782 RepID=UPI001FF9A063|nr:transglycosylase SLT domain-containing protein [Streptomyces sp. XM4193]MCK1796552.1 transglycosylase SLT domain-containing protein [Streptomyces sp. XM4193]
MSVRSGLDRLAGRAESRLSNCSTGRRVVVAGAATIGAATLALSGLSGHAHAQPLAAQDTVDRSVVADAQQAAREATGGDRQYECFSRIVEQESDWDHTAQDPQSDAYGLLQADPEDGTADAGSDWRTDPATQARWAVQWLDERYGSTCAAWDVWKQHDQP